MVAEARARGLDVSCETCPHYLVLTDEDAERLGALAKCAPPLRPRAELDALWTVHDPAGASLLCSGQIREPATPGYAGIAEAHQRALGKLAALVE